MEWENSMGHLKGQVVRMKWNQICRSTWNLSSLFFCNTSWPLSREGEERPKREADNSRSGVVVQLPSCIWLCDPMDCSSPGLSILHCLLEFPQIHVRWVSDAIQPSHPLLSPSPPALNLSQHQGLFQWVGSSHQVAKVWELQLQHQSFQWVFRLDFV